MDKPRSLAQNRALHKFFDQVATVLMEHGVTLKELLEKFKEESTPPTGENVKQVYKSIQKQMYGMESTTQATHKSLNGVYEVFHKGIAELTGESIDFPSEEMRQLLNHYK